MDLFSGPGGLTIGFKRAGIFPVCAVEKRQDAVDTFSGHTPEAEHFCEDIREVDLSKYRGKVDVLYGGPPCQPFSTGGLRRGEKDNRNMIPAFLEAAEELKPQAVFMENVPGLVVKSRVAYLHTIMKEIEELGYHVSCRVLRADHYGVPQKRRRLFVVAFRDRQFWFPRATHGPETDRPVVASKTVISHEPKGVPPNCPVVYAKYPDLRRSPYAGHVYNGGGRPIDLEAPCHTILASSGGYKTHWVDTLGIVVEYHEHLMGGGKPREGEVPGARRITVEEAAMIQTFPPDLVFAGSRSSQYTQVGDAVPPLLAEQLGKALASQLTGELPDEKTHYPPPETQRTLW